MLVATWLTACSGGGSSSGTGNALVPGDDNADRDIYLRDLTTLGTVWISHDDDGYSRGDHPCISGDGTLIFFYGGGDPRYPGGLMVAPNPLRP